MSHTISIPNILVAALLLSISKIKRVALLGLPLLIVILYTCWNQEWLAKQLDDFDASGFIVLLAFFICSIMAITGLHRTFLLPARQVKRYSLYRFGFEEFRYVANYLKASLVAILFSIPFIMMTTFLESMGIPEKLTDTLATIPFVYFLSRFSLSFPAASIGKQGLGLRWSWKATQHNAWSVTFLIGFIPIITSFLLDLLPDFDSLIYTYSMWILSLFIIVMEICIISLTYNELSAESMNLEN